MEKAGGNRIMRGCGCDDPNRLAAPDDLIYLIEKIGFPPLFANAIPGFSAEEHTLADDWRRGIRPQTRGNGASFSRIRMKSPTESFFIEKPDLSLKNGFRHSPIIAGTVTILTRCLTTNSPPSVPKELWTRFIRMNG